jgi:hypothetical protein
MSDRKQKRLELLYRLREMKVAEARADHVAAQTELEDRKQQADDTQGRLAALDEWAVERMAGGSTLLPEVMQQTRLYRGVETDTLERQRADETESREQAEAARTELSARFEELSVVERLAQRHTRAVTDEGIRTGYAALDEAGVQRKLGMKE